MRAIIVGIDGGSKRIIDVLAREGKLPNISKLMEQGVQGNLQSTIPPHTAPGWASIITGVEPGSHGIYQFFDTQSPDYTQKIMGSENFHVKKIWNILNEQGISTGMVNIPMTYPPEKVNGYMLSWPLVKTLRYSYPDSLVKEIVKVKGHYLPDIYSMFTGDLSYIDEALEIIEKRVATIEYLLEQYPTDFLMVVFPEIDRVSHFYWNYMDKSNKYYIAGDKKYQAAIEEVYIQTDQAIGEIFRLTGEDNIKILLSDHGFGNGDYDFYVNNYLKDFAMLNVVRKEILQEDNEIQTLLSAKKQKEQYSIDWKNTKAYMAAPGSYGVNINLKGRQTQGIVEQSQYEKTREEVIKILEKVEDQKGNLLFKKVLKSEDVYRGKAVLEAPDIIIIPRSYGTMIHHGISEGEYFMEPEQKGMHRIEGCLVLTGPNIRKGSVEDARVEDIMPTLLYGMNLPIPKYVEGKVLDIYQKEYKEKHPLQKQAYTLETANTNRSAYTAEEEELVKKQLKTLGYL